MQTQKIKWFDSLSLYKPEYRCKLVLTCNNKNLNQNYVNLTVLNEHEL